MNGVLIWHGFRYKWNPYSAPGHANLNKVWELHGYKTLCRQAMRDVLPHE